MKHLRYMGEFLSVSGVVWRVEIMQEADAEFATVGALEFPADEPLVIEWENKSKEEVICSSVATLKVISPGDRTYEDLYSIEVGRVRMDVYRNNALYWSGCIDTEFYEEPYEQLNGYEVSLTFSDFGVLDRLKYDLANMQTLYDIVSYCIGRCGINCGGIDDSLISTSLTPTGSAFKLSDIKVRSDNFYDEDGEASTLEEVTEGILQPLALRIVQRAGKVYVYDINGLYTKAAQKRIVWDGDSQNMGVDVVYNNAKITWSTYAQSGNLSPQACWPDSIETPVNVMSLNNLSGGSMNGAHYFSYHYENKDLTKWIDANDCGFTIWLTKNGNNAELGDGTLFFKIVPQYDGTEAEGVAVRWTAVAGIAVSGPGYWQGQYSMKPYGCSSEYLTGYLNDIGEILFKSAPVWIPPVEDGRKLVLRIALEMMMDPRFNPFENAENNEIMAYGDHYSKWNTRGNFVYVPVTIKFQPDGSDAVYVWDNREIVTLDVKYPRTHIASTYGNWFKSAGTESPDVWGWLAYYDARDRGETSGVTGWKKNRPAINPHTADTLSILTNADPGQYIPYPDFEGRGGKLWVEVRAGNWQITDGNVTLKNEEFHDPDNLWRERISWILFKLPEIEIMNGTQFEKTINTDDVEYNAQLNSMAKEPIKIDTICGTSAEGVPTARGAYFKAKTGKQITELTRAGRTTQAEDLLIGTLYSQFAQRRTTLSGEAQLMYDPVTVYTEANQDNKLFMATEDVQDVRMDCSDAIYVEIRPDEYKRNNE